MLDVLEMIMRERSEPMTVRQIADLAGNRLPTTAVTPERVIAKNLALDIKKNGEASRFARTEPGKYTLREFLI